ncbi:uncharacterized protein LOC121426007 [Lytechinus variegatus]|uniref:uncharacterized protein LOC121426007 n=1 Tax=Lytechinus variegatus TaxID=7654 RepID=UPI001BB155AF|nr:uncharacterized protein LOC121426007 [Lytechinus variegatus]
MTLYIPPLIISCFFSPDSSDSDLDFKRKKCLRLPDDESDSDIGMEKKKKRLMQSKKKKRPIVSDSDCDSDIDLDEERKKKKKHLMRSDDGTKQKRRWSQKELEVFSKNVAVYIERKVMAPRIVLDRVVEQLAHSRTVAQIRSRANNMIKEKQVFIL